jgi:dihydroneopterin aldolase
LIFDLELGLDTRQAGETDCLQYTVDYKAVTDRVRDFARDSQFKLIEALAENITRILLAEFPVRWVRLKINKQGVVRHVRDVCVIIERGSRT